MPARGARSPSSQGELRRVRGNSVCHVPGCSRNSLVTAADQSAGDVTIPYSASQSAYGPISSLRWTPQRPS